MRYTVTILSALLCAAAVMPAAAQAPTRLRGTIVSVDGPVIHVAPTTGGDDKVGIAAARITLVSPTTLADVKTGSFIGAAAKSAADGSLEAVEVHVFPESMRGAGEGHRPFDLGPKSTMTNGTVGQEVVGKDGQTLTVTYKGGEKRIVVPPNTPVVALEPGDAGLLIKGAHVTAIVQPGPDGQLAATSVLVGKDGLTPPM